MCTENTEAENKKWSERGINLAWLDSRNCVVSIHHADLGEQGRHTHLLDYLENNLDVVQGPRRKPVAFFFSFYLMRESSGGLGPLMACPDAKENFCICLLKVQPCMSKYT